VTFDFLTMCPEHESNDSELEGDLEGEPDIGDLELD
jgi:hypothetical protein